MIYLYKGTPNTIVTDTLGEILLDEFVVYIDDILIGTFTNEFYDPNYITFSVLPEQLIELNNAEAYLKIFYYDKLVKQELISILDFDVIKPIKIKEKNNTIKYYEK